MTVVEMIERFAIRYGGGDVLEVHGTVTDVQIEQIRAMKPQLLEHFRNQKKEEQLQRVRDHAAVNAIAGVSELRSYRNEAVVLPQGCTYASYEALMQAHPEIDFHIAEVVLRIEQDRLSSIPAVAALAKGAFRALAGGEDPGTVIRRYERDWVKMFDERIKWAK